MTRAEQLLALAERVESATEADRELDVAIGLTQQFYIAEPRYPGADPMIGYIDDEGCRVEPGNGAQDRLVPAYTASLDAATALFPAGAMYRSGHDGAGPDPSLFFCEVVTDAPRCDRIRSLAATEPAARLATALRTLAAQEASA